MVQRSSSGKIGPCNDGIGSPCATKGVEGAINSPIECAGDDGGTRGDGGTRDGAGVGDGGGPSASASELELELGIGMKE